MQSALPDVRLDTSWESLLRELSREPRRAVLATLVATAGSTYRKPGARMLIADDGTCHGLLSGGCLEADLGIHAGEVLASGAARAVDYDLRGPDDILFGSGAGCSGTMRVLLEPVGPGTPAAAALDGAGRLTRTGRAASLVMIHTSTDLPLGTYDTTALTRLMNSAAAASAAVAEALLSAAGRALCDLRSHASCPTRAAHPTGAFVQFLGRAPHLVICGAGPDVAPVVAAAVAVGWRVTVVDHRPAYAVAARFPGADVHCAAARNLPSSVALDQCHAAVVMSHHLASDTEYLRALAAAGQPAYVGLLGPAARRRRIVDELGALAEPLRDRLRGPVGIDLGAETPEGIALSIISDIHAWLAHRTPRVMPNSVQQRTIPPPDAAADS